MDELTGIFKRLQLNKDNGLLIFNENNWKGQFSQKTEYALERIRPDALYCFNDEPLILFFNNPESISDVHKKCWNFNRTPVIFISTPVELKIYNGFSFDIKKERLYELTSKKNLEKFSYNNIVSGELWRDYQKDLDKTKRLDFKLLQNIEQARTILIKEQNLPSLTANRLLGRLIFTRYLIDRKIKLDYNKKNNGLLTNHDLLKLIIDKDALYDFFEFLNSRFRGDLFPLNGEKHEVESNHLDILYRLFNGEQLKDRQLSLFNFYNFDIIPVEFISNIYEYFIGKDKQGKAKAFYTPPFLVDYIMKETVNTHLREKRDGVPGCKILDPSCGSGIFLVETLRILIMRFKKSRPQLKPSDAAFKEGIKGLLVNNIFGIDKDLDALEIAVFSLYVTLLDFFEEPRDINGFEFPHLLGINLIEADFFDLNHPFQGTIGTGAGKTTPDFILGNPPWGKVDSPYINYIKKRAKSEKTDIEISDRQIAQAFMLRVSDFSGPNTRCYLIISSKILYNLQADKFRRYFLENFFIDQVLEISSVRKQIFAKAVGPAAIISYRYSFHKQTDDNKLIHIALKPNPFFDLFKSILIEKHDYKEIRQNFLKQYDWAWKVLVYGSVLDFYFLKRLRNQFPTLEDILSDNYYRLITGEGAQVGNKKYKALHLMGQQFINTNIKKEERKNGRSDLVRFHIYYRENSKWVHERAERPKTDKKEIFQAPMLLIKSGLQNDFKIVASISVRDAVFTKSIFSIKSFSDKSILNKLLGILASELLTYYIFIAGTSTGVEREQLFDKELLTIPIVLNDDIGKIAESLLELHNLADAPENFELGLHQSKIQKKESELNQRIFELYKLDETERDLLKYAQEISIPILQGKTDHSAFARLSSSQWEDYARLFVDHFSKFHNNKQNGFFRAEIYETPSVLAMNFKISREKPNQIVSRKTETGNENFVEFLAGIAFQKISNKLFIQKDIKGIRKDSFYVIKPNQYKYWHRAVARLDIIEFENSMMQSRMEVESHE